MNHRGAARDLRAPPICPLSSRATMRSWARRTQRDSVAVHFATRDPQRPHMPRALALLAAGYALSRSTRS
jgi:hypothetical protein